VLPALFGPNYRIVTAPAQYTRVVYGDRDPASGTLPEVGAVDDHDAFELRRFALVENLLGRFGYYRGVPAVMLWNTPHGWEDMLAEVIGKLGVPDDGVVTVGCGVLGTVADFSGSRASGK
jgi:hypothetical protein